jgi:hypothetical protein
MINKNPTIEDVYNFDFYISTPGVREGLMQQSEIGGEEFSVEDTDDGQAVYFNTPYGEQVPVGRPVQLAAGPAQTVTDANPYDLPMEAQNMPGVSPGQFVRGLADTAALGVKGATQAFVGLPGDIISLARGAFDFAKSGGEFDAFVAGLSKPTGLPTTEEVKTAVDRIAPLGPDKMLSDVYRNNPEDAKLVEGIGEFAAPGGYIKGAKTAVQGVKAAGSALGPVAADMAGDLLRKQGLMPGIVEPSKFNPKVELPKAVEFVAVDPNLNVYLPQAQRAPSVALRLAKPEIKGTGEKGALTVGDIGLVLEKSQLSLNRGKPLDPTKPKDLVKMIDSATAEAEFQMSQPISGATWYEDDVFQAFALGAKVVPDLATDEPLRVMATAFAASTSYNKRASENWSVAMRITEDLMKTGKVASRNPENGKLWGGTTGPTMEQQLKLHEFMIDKMGMDGYAEWLLTPHTVKEIIDMRAASGLYKTPGIPGKATDLKMGSFIMGEKGGAFFLNLNGIKETTADKWFTRTYNRHTGTLTSGPVSEQGLVDAPRNESERSVMKVWNRSVAENMKLDEQANQAVLWYYEQSLYYNMGIKSARSESFSDGAKNLLNARGIPFTDAELAGARGRSNAPKVAAEQTGAGAGGNPVGIGQAAPTQTATPTKVNRGRSAPNQGAN